ncbi:MAG: hypothetical protein R3C10_02590 [Pirellulales bacterium]
MPTRTPATAGLAASAAPAAALSPSERGALDAIARAGDDAEVIVIVRSRRDPTATSQIIVLDHASPTLLDHLSQARPAGPTQSAGPTHTIAPTQPPATMRQAQQLAPPGQPSVARR